MSKDNNDAFEQAENLDSVRNEDVIQEPSVAQEDTKDDKEQQVEAKPKKEASKPQELPVKPAKKKNVGTAVSLALGTVALVVSLSSIMIAFNSSQNDVPVSRADLDAAFSEIDSKIDEMAKAKTDMEFEIGRIKRISGENNVELRKLSNQPDGVADINRQIEQLNQKLSSSELNSVNIEKLNQDLKAFQEKLRELSAQKAKIIDEAEKPKKVYRPTAYNAPVKSSIEGYNVLTIDRWGFEKNAVLFNPKTSDYQHIAPGEQMNGWTYKQDNNISVVFQKGNKYLRVLVKEKGAS